MASPQGITRQEARDICASAVLRNGSYNPADSAKVARLDMAIDAAFGEFCTRVKIDVASDTSITVAAHAETIDVSTITDFELERYMQAWLTTGDGVPTELHFVDYKVALMALKGVYYEEDWVPGMKPPVAFAGSSNTMLAGWKADRSTIQLGSVFSDDAVLHLDYYREFNRGTSTTKFNVPRQYCDQICWWGVPLYYDSMQTQQPMAGSPLTRIRVEWENLIARCRFPTMNKAVQVRPKY